MVSDKEIQSANTHLSNKSETLTAVFAGATSGIGLGTLKAFAKHIPKPVAIIVGRSRSKFQAELDNLRSINPNGEFIFLEAEISIIKNIDAVCEEIQKLPASSGGIDLLFVSQGYISFTGREENADGLDNSTSLRYYGRVRFTENLLPILKPHGRVISVLAGGWEGKIFEDDLDLEKHYSIQNCFAQFPAMMSLTYDTLAKQNPDKSFIHIYPGIVSTPLLGNSTKGLLRVFLTWVVEPIMNLFSVSTEVSGERMLYVATDGQYEGPYEGDKAWTLVEDGSVKVTKEMVEYRERGLADKVVEHNRRIFERTTA